MSDPAEPMDEVIAEEPTFDAEGYKAEANKLYQKAEYAEAVGLYTKAIELDDSVAIYFGNRAAAYIQLKKWEKALADCERALRKDSKYLKGYFRSGKCYTELGRLMEAKKSFEKAAELGTGRKAQEELKNLERLVGLTKKAKELLEANNFAEALRYVQNAQTISNSAAVRVLKGRVHIGLKQNEFAANLMSQVLMEDNNNSDALAVRGTALYRMGNHNQAINHAQHALRSDPDHKLARELLKKVRKLERSKKEGNEAFKAADYEQALKSFTAALECDPGNDTFNATLYCNRAAVYMKMSKYEESVADCTSALERDETYFKALVRRAQSYEKLDQWEEAVRDWTAATDHKDGSRDTKISLKEAKKQWKIAKRKDYYKILEIKDKQLNPNQIKKAYLKVARKFHPDKHSSKSEEERAAAEKQFKEIQEAYAILSDPEKKARYDNGEDFEDIEHGGQGGFPGGAGVNMADIFEMFNGGGGGGGGFDHGGFGFGGGGFGGGGGRRGGGGFNFY